MKAVTKLNPEIRILKAATCPSLSGKSTLSYQVGFGVLGVNASDIDPVIQLRVYANTGGGFFNKDWIPLSTIQQLFDKCPSDKAITSFSLYPLFKGRSLNTPAFLLAVLKQEGFLRPLADKKRSYERIDPTEFMTEIKSLIEAKGSAASAASSPVAAVVEDKAKQAKPSKPVVAGKKVASQANPNEG